MRILFVSNTRYSTEVSLFQRNGCQAHLRLVAGIHRQLHICDTLGDFKNAYSALIDLSEAPHATLRIKTRFLQFEKPEPFPIH